MPRMIRFHQIYRWGVPLLGLLMFTHFVLIDYTINGLSEHNETDGKSQELKGQQKSIHPKCPWSANCTYVGYEWKSGRFKPRIQTAESTGIKILRPDTRETVTIDEIIHLYDMNTDYKHHLSVCVQPLFLYQDWQKLAHFIEMWHQMGASHFYLYHQSSSNLVNDILDMYVKSGEVTLLPWPELPSNNNQNPNDFLYRAEMFTAVQDCLLRSRQTSEFTAFVDLDELIVPSDPNKNVLGLLDILDAHSLNATHTVLKFVNKEITHFMVPNYQAQVYHLRTVSKAEDQRFDKDTVTKWQPTDVLMDRAQAAETRWDFQLKNARNLKKKEGKLTDKLEKESVIDWWDDESAPVEIIKQTAEAMQKCLDELLAEATQKGTCPAAAHRCLPYLSVNKSDFVYSVDKNRWIEI